MTTPQRIATGLVAGLISVTVLVTSIAPAAAADAIDQTTDTIAAAVDAVTPPDTVSIDPTTDSALPTRTTTLSERQVFTSRSREAVTAARALAPHQYAKFFNGPSYARWYAVRHIQQAYGWGKRQMNCLNQLWTQESSWRIQAMRPNGAFLGIPQLARAAVLASGYSVAEFRSSVELQVQLGTKYIKYRKGYGTPCAALAHFKRKSWY